MFKCHCSQCSAASGQDADRIVFCDITVSTDPDELSQRDLELLYEKVKQENWGKINTSNTEEAELNQDLQTKEKTTNINIGVKTKTIRKQEQN